jgi:ribonuclease HII
VIATITGGLDEVGWGALAGPLISVIAVFRDKDMTFLPAGVKDSKKCSELLRESLYEEICQCAYDIGIGHAWPWEIDSYGPAKALQLSFSRAVTDIKKDRMPHLLYVDGVNPVKDFSRSRQVVEPKADVKYKQVSAASIIAKVFRDKIMASYAKTYQAYGWERNKGYGSEEHTTAIRQYGILADERDRNSYIHRRRYCQKILLQATAHVHTRRRHGD